ncbi:hypothetical protein H696_00450 [Fonticula alba]|uniref:Uncharacterized protein n=1 Tax=Fonticula alba TaxID=691883 RepID=A0A058ZET0_FONAL|nr:hypothetical protein H696_00450 [Fonticula alba]KCV72879.1 hypothetical protein H696_00450 [Fonticula alba]|eukprot:XP_009492580.1 hypothetical protein H696_00450 [Fonticula alba]
MFRRGCRPSGSGPDDCVLDAPGGLPSVARPTAGGGPAGGWLAGAAVRAPGTQAPLEPGD